VTRGGGVALIHSNRFTPKRITFDFTPTTFEVLGCSLRSDSVNVVYVVIYRPGSDAVSERFFEELTELLEVVAALRSQVIVAGDFNIHVNDPADRHASRLADLLDSLDLAQAVLMPTHRDENTLDLVITRSVGRQTSCAVDRRTSYPTTHSSSASFRRYRLPSDAWSTPVGLGRRWTARRSTAP